MGRTNTVKFLDELSLSVKGYAGSGAYKRIHVNAVNGFTQKDFDIITKGTATSTSADNLVDTSASFESWMAGKVVHNTTDDTYATISTVTSATELALDTNIMAIGERYTIVETDLIGNTVLIVPVTPVTKSVAITIGDADVVTFTAGTPAGLGQRAGNETTDTIGDLGVASVTCAWVSGDQLVFDVYVDPEGTAFTSAYPGTDMLYVESKSGSTAELTRSIKEKGVIKHRKRNLDPDRTLSVSQKFQARDEGLMSFSGREYILTAKRLDDNYLVATEYDYYFQCYHNSPEPSGSTGAQDSTLSFDIMYEKRISISA